MLAVLHLFRSKIAEVIRKNKGLPPLEPEENNSTGKVIVKDRI